MSTVLRRSDVARILERRCSLTAEQAESVINELFGVTGTGNGLVDPGLFHEAVANGITVDLAAFGRFERRTWKGSSSPPLPGQTKPSVKPVRYRPFFKPWQPFTRLVQAVTPAPENGGTP